MKTTIFCLVLLSLFLAACTTAPTPTNTSTPTKIPTQTPTSTPAPTNTITPTITLTFTPTLAPTAIVQPVVLTKSPDLILAVDKPSREACYPDLKVLYTLPSEDRVLLASELVFYGKLFVDIYYPPGYHFDKKLPIVILAHGFPGSELCDKDMPQHIAWAKLIAASGMIAVSAQPGDNPSESQNHLLDYLAANAGQLGIDPSRIGFWVVSGQGDPVTDAFSKSQYSDNFKAAVFMYSSSNIPILWPKNLALFVVKAGKDNDSGDLLDLLVNNAKENKIPVKYVDLPDEDHAFDTNQNTQDVNHTIQQALDFYKQVLLK
ncbi:MAG TPA: hypothetical protein VKF38_12735 [Anaerolineaceae bacterium]|nr:hypothetical protein [Anaerolineaceae bacterium]